MAFLGDDTITIQDPLRIVLGWPADWQERWEERAAIMEYDAGMTRDGAERAAVESVRLAMAAGGATTQKIDAVPLAHRVKSLTWDGGRQTFGGSVKTVELGT